MPIISPSAKGGKNVDSSDLLAQKKRNIYVQEQKSKGTQYTQIENKSFGYDTLSLINSQRGLDQYLDTVNVVIISGSFRFEGSYSLFTLDTDALTVVFARQFGVPVSSITLTVSPGSVIVAYTITATTIQAQVITSKVEFGTALQNFGSALVNDINGSGIAGLTLTGTTVTAITSNQIYVANKNTLPFIGNSLPNHSSDSMNGTGAGATLTYPTGLSIDSDGNLYISDNFSLITKVTSAGVTSTLQKNAFPVTYPTLLIGQIVVDNAKEYMYLSDSNYQGTINKVKISTGEADRTWELLFKETLRNCSGLAISSDDKYLYFSEILDCQIKVIDLTTNIVSVIAGTKLSAGFLNGTGLNAKFNAPTGIALDNTNKILYVVDTNNHSIRRINLLTNAVTTLVGNGSVGWTDAAGTNARFNGPTNITFNSNSPNYLIVSDTGNNAIRQITISNLNVQTLGGTGIAGFNEGAGTSARFNNPLGVALSNSGILYISDAGNYRIRQMYITYVDPSTQVTSLAGSPGYILQNGIGELATFNGLASICYDGSGNLYVSDTYNYAIRKINISTRAVTSLIVTGYSIIRGICYDASENIYFCDGSNNSIYKVILTTRVVTPVVEYIGGGVCGICYDGSGNLYVSGVYDNTIKKIVISSRVVTTIATGFNQPTDLCLDGSGNLYVCDSGSNAIKKVVISTGIVTTIATGFETPYGLCYDGSANLYVCDSNNFCIKKIIISTGNVTILTGSVRGYQNGSRSSAMFLLPYNICYDGIENLYMNDTVAGNIRKIVLPA